MPHLGHFPCLLTMYENIKKLSETPYTTFKAYFFDANVWLAYLEADEGNISTDYALYIKFIDKIVEGNLLEKENEPKISIVMTSLLLSEIMNRYMRDTAMRKHFGKDYRQKNFKNDYRPTEHYKTQLSHLLNNFKRFEICFYLLPDNLAELSFFENLPTFEYQEKDFNDFYFYQLAKKYDFPIVTHDGDFLDQDIVIITQNSKTWEKIEMFKPNKKKR